MSEKKFTRRQFAAGTAIAGIGATLVGRLPQAFGQSVHDLHCDVLVCAATPGGISAAITAARLGHSVIVAEYEDHIGGIVSNGLTNTDLDPNKRNAVGGFFNEYSANVLKHYTAVDPGGADAPNIKLCRSGFAYEAKVAESIFTQMLQAETNIRVLTRHELTGVTVRGGKVTSAAFVNHADQKTVHIAAKVFIDATYEGDLAAAAKCPYTVGRESRAAYNEPHAGRIYMRFGTHDLLPGSTGEADSAIQAFCFRFIVTKKEANRAPILKPEGYNREDYFYLLEDIRAGRIAHFEQCVGLFALPNGKYQFNSLHPRPETGVPSESLDLAEENWAWPDATFAERHKIFLRYRTHNVGMLWMLQNDAEVPASIRKEALQYGWCKDEWVATGNIPRQVYMREARRIKGRYVVTERDGDMDAAIQRTTIRPDSIAVVQWEFDSHGCHKFDPAHPGVREGYTFVPHPPLQVPYGTIVPQGPANVLVPVACSTSHVAYNALRMEPVFMALGEASGVAAHLAIRNATGVADVPVPRLQQQLLAHSGVITYIEDLHFGDPDFAAMQWLSARGFNNGYLIKPDSEVTRADAAAAMQRVMQAMGKTWSAPSPVDASPMTQAELHRWLAAGKAAGKSAASEAATLTVRGMAAILYTSLSPAPDKA
jgi:hypothetical protein